MENMLKLSDRQVPSSDYDQLFNLLIKSEFPENVPNLEALQIIAPYIYYHGIYDGNKLIAMLSLYFDPEHPHALGFEGACLPEYRSKWAYKSLFAKVFKVAFKHFKKDYVFANTQSEEAAKALKALGFTKLYLKPDGLTHYTLNYNHVLPRLRA